MAILSYERAGLIECDPTPTGNVQARLGPIDLILTPSEAETFAMQLMAAKKRAGWAIQHGNADIEVTEAAPSDPQPSASNLPIYPSAEQAQVPKVAA